MASLGARDRQALLVENFVPEKRSTLSIPLKGDVSPVRVLAAHREGFFAHRTQAHELVSVHFTKGFS
ncbi:hypothetical protein [Mesorhizobium sp. M0276]|uniref:hypothetical protein n=1 Tax=Mesorhizobium sp. M0276 TaxID=2956928 RepID=UPI0033388F93